MRALHWNGQVLKLEGDHAPPKLIESMALVRVRLAGICSTDLQILKGYMGFRGVPGHEFVGEVCEGPSGLLGKRVVGEINFACGRCAYCFHGLARHCADRRVMGILGADGTFAEYVAVPAGNLHPVPDGLDDESAVFTEPLAAAFEILEQVQIKPSDKVFVLGDGKLGLLCAQVLHAAGAQVTLVGKHLKKLTIARQLGIPVSLIDQFQPSRADVVVEATGSTAGLTMALSLVRPRGTLVLKSTVAEPHTISLATLVVNEIYVVGSRCGLFSPALRALSSRAISVAPLIDQVYSLADGVEAAAHAARPGALKILLRCS
jgi:threonine dehydrogenase-like Zn-dependent dehydrogenase